MKGDGGPAPAAATPLEQLWRQFKEEGDAAAREALILRYLPLVKFIAGRLVMHLPPMVELDDLISYGVFGLIDALEKFDPRRGIRFETYAYARIKGAILDGLRAVDWVPQSLRRRAREVEAAYAAVQGRLGRSASDREVAEALGITEGELQELLRHLNAVAILSLDDVIASDEDGEGALHLRDVIADDTLPSPLDAAELADARERLAAAIAQLPERERLILSLYYYEGLTVKEIGAILELSPSRVSQLHTKAILRLRGLLRDRGRPGGG